jgi:hypothetical protein
MQSTHYVNEYERGLQDTHAWLRYWASLVSYKRLNFKWQERLEVLAFLAALAGLHVVYWWMFS